MLISMLIFSSFDKTKINFGDDFILLHCVVEVKSHPAINELFSRAVINNETNRVLRKIKKSQASNVQEHPAEKFNRGKPLKHARPRINLFRRKGESICPKINLFFRTWNSNFS
jgi:hypothetical protein